MSPTLVGKTGRNMTFTVVFDGECAICGAFRRWMEQHDTRRRLRFVAYQSSELEDAAPGVAREDARRSLIFIRPGGHTFSGARAVFEAMRQLGGFWGVMGAVMSWPPLSLAAEPFYRLFARHRGRFARFVHAHNP